MYTDSTKRNISLALDDGTRELEVLVEFSALNRQNSVTNYWCHDIKLFIIYGAYLEFLKGKSRCFMSSHPIPQFIVSYYETPSITSCFEEYLNLPNYPYTHIRFNISHFEKLEISTRRPSKLHCSQHAPDITGTI